MEAEATSILENPLMNCDEVENILGIEHTEKPIINSLGISKTPIPESGDTLNKLKEKAR